MRRELKIKVAVSPAHAGIDLAVGLGAICGLRFPRPRGDRPLRYCQFICHL